MMFDVAVVGTGLVGLATAVGCSQHGLKVALIGSLPASDQTAATFDARIYALAPASVRLLEQLKVWPHVLTQRIQRVERMRVFGDAGEELSFDAYSAAVERLATIVEERELARVLGLAVGFASHIEQYNTVFERLQVGADQATVILANGQQIQAKLVIAADGAQSALRAAAGMSADTVDYQQTGVVANFHCESSHVATAWQWFTAEGVVALLPLPERHVSLVWSAPNALAHQLLALSTEDFADRVSARTNQRLGELRLMAEPRAFPLRRMRVNRLVDARIALVGDAAHVVHPLAGQGLNLGLQDVSVLLRVLNEREAWRDLGDRALLRRYARARVEAIELMRFATDGLARLFLADDPVLKRLRNGGLAALNKISPLKRALISHALG